MRWLYTKTMLLEHGGYIYRFTELERESGSKPRNEGICYKEGSTRRGNMKPC